MTLIQFSKMDAYVLSACATAVAGLLVFHWFVRGSAPHIKSLKDKHVLITGGTSGIGLATAKEAISQGAFVTIVSRSAANLHNAVESVVKDLSCDRARIFSKVADVRDYQATASAIQEAFKWRPVDVLVCNAGLTRGGFIESQRIEDLDVTIQTNFTGTAYAVHAALPLMKKHSTEHPGSVVLIGSLSSLYVFYGHSIYTATKHAVKGLAESLKLELAPYNIRVSLICPGFVDTPFLDEAEQVDGSLKKALEVVNLYDRRKAEDPRDVAKSTLEAAKLGKFLVTKNNFPGLYLSTLSRGALPAESWGRFVVELIMFFPFRVLSVLNGAEIRKTIIKLSKGNP